jgi:acetyltransferase-like isoleucine patch superfamily enzyme
MDHFMRENKTPFQAALMDQRMSALQKYQDIAVGERGLGALLRYEFFTCCLAGLPGALGLWLRGRLYRHFLGHMGRNVVIGKNVTIRNPRRISLGDSVIIDDGCVLDAKGQDGAGIVLGANVVLGRNTVLSCKGGSIALGHNTNISMNCIIISESSVRIGANVLFAANCYVIAGGNHGTGRTDVAIIQQDSFSKGGVVIEDNAWLGAGVKVLDGVNIGRDAVAGAGSVVVHNIPAFTVAAGMPAKVIKNRRQSSTEGNIVSKADEGHPTRIGHCSIDNI